VHVFRLIGFTNLVFAKRTANVGMLDMYSDQPNSFLEEEGKEERKKERKNYPILYMVKAKYIAFHCCK